jgi:hypothetical protein
VRFRARWKLNNDPFDSWRAQWEFINCNNQRVLIVYFDVQVYLLQTMQFKTLDSKERFFPGDSTALWADGDGRNRRNCHNSQHPNPASLLYRD